MEQKVCDVVSSVMELDDLVRLEESLKILSVNSIQFIKIVVECEQIFKIEFDDEKLDFNLYETIADLVNYVDEKTSEN
jgi:acyl carrier protein